MSIENRLFRREADHKVREVDRSMTMCSNVGNEIYKRKLVGPKKWKKFQRSAYNMNNTFAGGKQIKITLFPYRQHKACKNQFFSKLKMQFSSCKYVTNVFIFLLILREFMSQ